MDTLWMMLCSLYDDTPMWHGWNSMVTTDLLPKQTTFYMENIQHPPTRQDLVKETLIPSQWQSQWTSLWAETLCPSISGLLHLPPVTRYYGGLSGWGCSCWASIVMIEFKSTDKRALYCHIKSALKKYSCDLWNFQADRKHKVMNHKRSKHPISVANAKPSAPSSNNVEMVSDMPFASTFPATAG